MDRDSKFPDLKVTRMGGIDQRSSPDSFDNEGHPSFSILEGMYPSQDGLLSRVPGKTLLAILPGEIILNICQPFDSTGNILVQTSQNLYAFTLDELLGRTYTPTVTPSSGSEDEGMSLAIMSHKTANATNGGALDATSTVDTFYTRTLNTNEVNQATIITAFSGNAFTLATGTYRIHADIIWNPLGSGTAIVGTAAGLFNNTSSTFEVYAGGSEPILATAGKASTASVNEGGNQVITLDAVFTVSGSTSYSIKQKVSVSAAGTGTSFCGAHDQCVNNANVNGAKSQNYYLLVKIWKQ